MSKQIEEGFVLDREFRFFESWEFEGEVWLTKSIREREEPRKKRKREVSFLVWLKLRLFTIGFSFFWFRGTVWNYHPPLPCRKSNAKARGDRNCG